MAFCLGYPDNQRKAKHVENRLAACLDEGSNPSSSTNNTSDFCFFTKPGEKTNCLILN